MDRETQEPDYSKPAAYTPDGKPLYMHPPEAPVSNTVPLQPPASPANIQEDYRKQVETSSHVTVAPEELPGENFDPRIRKQYSNEPEVFHTTRPIEPRKMVLSEESKRKHDESVLLYPHLNLSEGEYVILHVKRHIIGLLVPVLVTAFMIAALSGVLIAYPTIMSITSSSISYATIVLLLVPMIALALLFGYAAIWIYTQNSFYMTNESVIQEIQTSLFSRHEQAVSLGSIEDASFVQNGLFPTLLNFGTMRLSTEGDETTYKFHYVSNPHHQTAIIINAVEAFKNGRPVVDD